MELTELITRSQGIANKLGIDKITRSYPSQLFQDGNKLHGVASVYYDGTEGTEFRLLENLVERVDKEAFAKSLDNSKEVIATFNHNVENILGRTPNTLRLWSEDDGLHYEIDLPDTSQAKDLKELIKRGDVKGSSFMGFVRKAKYTKEGDKEVRTITEVDLIELGPVTLPAYQGTNDSLQLRSCELTDIARELSAWRETQKRIERLQEIRQSL